MRMFAKTVIIGTGLIGSSLGLALRKHGLTGRILGLSRRRKNALLAKKAGAIDEVAFSLDAVKDADLVILATPVETIIEFGLKIAGKINKDCVVIDVGSTKKTIVSRLSALIPNFVGCHPLAGSEKRGAANLKDNIFEGSVCIITPEEKTAPQALSKVRGLWKKLGARCVEMDAARHDRILALTSHLPHILSFSLISTVPDEYLPLSSSGLRDTTRLAASDAKLWSEIFLTNRANLALALSSFESRLAALKKALKNKNKKQLTVFLLRAQNKRKRLR